MEIGQKVTCVNPGVGLVKDKIYTISGVRVLSCGCICVSVGIISNIMHHIKCQRCNTIDGIVRMHYEERMYYSDRFAPIVTDEFLNSDQIEKVIEEKIDCPVPEKVN